MAQFTTLRLRPQINHLRTQPAPQPELGLDGALPKATIQRILTRVLNSDRSCRSALKRLGAWVGLQGCQLDDEDTSPYCKARARLPESTLRRLM